MREKLREAVHQNKHGRFQPCCFWSARLQSWMEGSRMSQGEDPGSTDHCFDGGAVPLEYRSDGPVPEAAVRRRRRIAWVLAVSACVALFFAGRASNLIWPVADPLLPRPTRPELPMQYQDHPEMLDHDARHFASVVAAWDGYVIAHDGDLPADPYKVLIDSGTVRSWDELRWYSFAGDVPPRINPDIGKNGHWAMFVWERKDIGEQWDCYADGTWARVPIPSGPSTQPSPHLHDLNSVDRLKAAGYPVWRWRNDADRAAWLAANRDKLVWDDARRMYVVASSPASRPAQTRPAALPARTPAPPSRHG